MQKILYIPIDTTVYSTFECEKLIKRGDIIALTIKIFANGALVDLTGQTVSLILKKADNTFIEKNIIDISNGTITAVLTTQATNAAGTVNGELTIEGINGQASTNTFTFVVDNAIASDILDLSENDIQTIKDLKTLIISGNIIDIDKRVTQNTTQLSEIPNQTYITEKAKITDVNNALALKADETALAVERARIDNFTTLEAGSTTGDAELTDIRIGFNGAAYENAGTSIREQTGLIAKTINLANVIGTLTEGYVLNYTNGLPISASGYAITDYIPISLYDVITLAFVRGKNLCGGVLYDKDKNYIKPIWGTDNWEQPTTDNNSKFSFAVTESSIAYLRYNVIIDSIYPRNRQFLLKQDKSTARDFNTRLEAVDDNTKDAIFQYNNIIDNLGTLTENYIIDYSNGNTITSTGTIGFAVTDYIPINLNDKVSLAFVRGKNLCGGVLYDKDENYIKPIWGTDDWVQPTIDNNKDFSFYVRDPNVRYIRYNVVIDTIFPRISQFLLVQNNKSDTLTTYYVSKSKTGNNIFSTLKECTEYIQNVGIYNAKVYVELGTYDLVSEFTQEYIDSITSATNKGFGLKIGNNTHFIFSENANVIFNYTGTNADASEYFSPFNAYGSYTLENADIEVSNARYCVHEDLPTSATAIPESYTAKYINCKMKHNGNTIGTYIGTVCIGGGTNKNSLSIVDGGKYTCGTQFPYAISYHNYNGSDTSRLIFRNVWVNNAIRLADFGTNPVEVEITGCYLPNGHTTGSYFSITEWNNVTV